MISGAGRSTMRPAPDIVMVPGCILAATPQHGAVGRPV